LIGTVGVRLRESDVAVLGELSDARNFSLIEI
jgi:hypothetical protein